LHDCLCTAAGGLSASTIGRLKEAWSEEHVRWSKRDLAQSPLTSQPVGSMAEDQPAGE
jgi:hypothetical protein